MFIYKRIIKNSKFANFYFLYLILFQLILDMAVQNCIGDAFRGATWVALHNGGGTGW